MPGIRRKKGMARTRKKPLLAANLAKGVLTLPETLLGLRNRALLLIGFAGALRRSELVARCWEQIEKAGWQSVEEINPQVRGGLKITVAKSKTDQMGEGRPIGIPFGENPITCPVRALEAWRAASELSAGPVFRVVGRAGKVMDEGLSDRAVARLVKQVAKAAGLNPQEFSGHSLRSGLATSAAAAGASERSIMEQTGHRDLKTARTYIRDGSLFRDNAAGKTGIDGPPWVISLPWVFECEPVYQLLTSSCRWTREWAGNMIDYKELQSVPIKSGWRSGEEMLSLVFTM